MDAVPAHEATEDDGPSHSPPAGAAHCNRLAQETSPYLLQHALNPVNWYPWGDEALARAKELDRPIFLSIGYSACHWCHVMERESFENLLIAQALNDHFVSIKVDREERPDLDEIYMAAVVAMTGSGGWPMSVFLTPDLIPFYGGTYYPPVDMYGRPGFPTVLKAVANAWKDRRDEVLRSAQGMREHLEGHLGGTESSTRGSIVNALLENAALQLRHTFDATHGGWGGAPKFPSSGAIQLLLRQHLREPQAGHTHIAAFTLSAMANGGIYDHLGGGFHRYSVDEQWLVPHFEKMLYDNAQLAQAYLEGWQVTGNPQYRRVVEETIDYVLRDMQDASGAFYSTEDADSEGQEGKFYLWTEAELRDRLGRDRASLFCACYNVRREGNFSSHEAYHRGQNILHVRRPLSEAAAEFGLNEQEAEDLLASARQVLLEARGQRVHPAKDDKIISAWNGLMLSALAQAARVFNADSYREAAERAAKFLFTEMYGGGRLLRTARGGVARLQGYLDDYAFVANAFLDLYECTFNPRWLHAAQELAESMQEYFWDSEQGAGFFYTAKHHRDVLLRTRPTYDGAEPSGNSIAALLLLRLSRTLNNPEYYHRAVQVLEANAGLMQRAPQGYLKMLCAVDFALGPGNEIALLFPGQIDLNDPLLRLVQQQYLPRTVVAAAAGDSGETGQTVPLLSGRGAIEGRTSAYVCRNFTCDLPVTDPAALSAKLAY